MSRFMAEMGLSPSARARLRLPNQGSGADGPLIVLKTIFSDEAREDDKSRTYGKDAEDAVVVLPPNADRV
jgi:hypothetical protein